MGSDDMRPLSLSAAFSRLPREVAPDSLLGTDPMSCRPSSAHGPLGCWHPLAAVNIAAVNIPTHSDKYPVSTIGGIDRGVELFGLSVFIANLSLLWFLYRKPHERSSLRLRSPLHALPVPRVHPRGHVSICSNNK